MFRLRAIYIEDDLKDVPKITQLQALMAQEGLSLLMVDRTIVRYMDLYCYISD